MFLFMKKASSIFEKRKNIVWNKKKRISWLYNKKDQECHFRKILVFLTEF